jgi:hypothetical protein
MDLLFFITSWLFTLYFNSYLIYLLYPIMLFLISEDLINMWFALLILFLVYVFILLYKNLLFYNF